MHHQQRLYLCLLIRDAFSFRGKGSIYQLVKDVINNDLSAALRNTVNVIASATVLAVLFFVLGYVIISAIQLSVVCSG